MAVERTLVLVKPDGVARGLSGEIVRRLEARGLVLRAAKLVKVTEELAGEHYAEHREKPFFGELVDVHHLVADPGARARGRGRDRVRALDDGRDEPAERGAGHDPRRLRARDAEQPRPRVGCARVGRARDRALVRRR